MKSISGKQFSSIELTFGEVHGSSAHLSELLKKGSSLHFQRKERWHAVRWLLWCKSAERLIRLFKRKESKLAIQVRSHARIDGTSDSYPYSQRMKCLSANCRVLTSSAKQNRPADNCDCRRLADSRKMIEIASLEPQCYFLTHVFDLRRSFSNSDLAVKISCIVCARCFPEVYIYQSFLQYSILFYWISCARIIHVLSR